MAVVDYQIQDGIARITLNRPEVLNAMNEEMSEGMREVFRRIDRDPTVRVAILTGAGDRAFSSGMDLRSERSTPDGRALIGETEEYAPWTLLRVHVPVIAAIHGYCLAGGLDLALAADLRIAADNARFGFPEVRWNFPDSFAVHLLTRAVPLAHAMDLLLRAHRIDAREAHRIGLVNEVVSQDRLLPRCEELAKEIAVNAPLALRVMKQLAYQSLHGHLDELMAAMGMQMRLLGMTQDAEEGRRAFPERRAPRYQAR